jgi:RND family efflux transporter MFP subunit
MNDCTSRAACLARGTALVLCLILLAAGCSRKKASAEEPVRPVKTTIVVAGEPLHERTFPGRVGASKQVELAFQVPGLIVSLPVREGQRVAKGEVIAELRKDEFEARLNALKGQLGQARAVLMGQRAGERPEQILRLEAQLRATEAVLLRARTEYERIRRMRESEIASQIEFEEAQTAYRVAVENNEGARQALETGRVGRQEDIDAQEATVRGLEARVVEAQLQLNDCTLRAPYDGVIAQRFVEQQQNVQAKQPIVRFQDVNEVEIAVDVPETAMAQIGLADIVRLVAEFSGAPGVRFPVRIAEIARTADPATQTFRVRAAMQAPTDFTLLPGMTGTVTMTYHRASVLDNRIHVPVTAVLQESSGAQVVWIVEEGKQVRRRAVKIGPPSGSQIEIVDGLQPGEQVVIAGVRFLRDGMKVRDLGDALGGGQQ